MLIYKHTCLENNKSYIGFTSLSIAERLKGHLSSVENGSNLKFHNALRKYGLGGFKSEVLEENLSSKEEVYMREKYWISFYDSFNNGYNMTLGGEGGDTTTDHPRKNEIIQKRKETRRVWFENLSEEEKQKLRNDISKSRKGNFREGYVPSESHRRKSSESNKQFWKNLSDEEREIKRQKTIKAMASRKGISTNNAKSVTIDGVCYDSMTKAAKALNTSLYFIKKKTKDQNA